MGQIIAFEEFGSDRHYLGLCTGLKMVALNLLRFIIFFERFLANVINKDERHKVNNPVGVGGGALEERLWERGWLPGFVADSGLLVFPSLLCLKCKTHFPS